MHIFDAHLDLALNGVDWNRDLRQSVKDIRAQETALAMSEPGRCTNTVSLPELRQAGVKTCLATLLARQEISINHDFGWSGLWAKMKPGPDVKKADWRLLVCILTNRAIVWSSNPQLTPGS